MTPRTFEQFTRILRDRSGLVVDDDKPFLLESRLAPVTRKLGFPSLDELIEAVNGERDDALFADILEAMTTSESLFFRDSAAFDYLRDVILPQLIAARAPDKTIRIWSAACAAGQEPYSIAMLVKELGDRLSGWQVEILATDLSEDSLERAREGVFGQVEVQRGLPVEMLMKYFAQQGDRWRIEPALQSLVTFKRFNLLDQSDDFGLFDIILCRNVLMYFDQETRRAVLEKLADRLSADGTLLLGQAETVLGTSEQFRAVSGRRGFYRKHAFVPIKA